MRMRIVIATLAGGLLLFGTPGAVYAAGDHQGDGCGYTRYCPDDRRDGASSGDPERWWNCREDGFRDDERYGTPCRWYSECTNYPRCED